MFSQFFFNEGDWPTQTLSLFVGVTGNALVFLGKLNCHFARMLAHKNAYRTQFSLSREELAVLGSAMRGVLTLLNR